MSELNNKTKKNQELALIIKNTYGKPELKDDYNKACAELLNNYTALIHKYAYSYKSDNLQLIFEDLIITLQQATIKACLTYDETKGANITTYLYRALSNAKSNFYKHNDITNIVEKHLPTQLKLYKAYQKLQEMNENINIENLMKLTECDKNTADAYIKFTKPVYLDDIVKSDSGDDFTTSIELIPSGEKPEEIAFETDKCEELKLAISFLPETRAEVINLIFYKGLTQVEVSKIFKTSRSNISKIQLYAIKNLKILYQPENLAAIKFATKLKEKHNNLIKNKEPSNWKTLLNGENISNELIFRAFKISQYKYFKKDIILEELNGEPFNLFNLSKKEKNFIKDVIVMNNKEELVNKYGKKLLTYNKIGR